MRLLLTTCILLILSWSAWARVLAPRPAPPLSPSPQALDQFHFVFIGGYLNEQIPDYFIENVKLLKDHGVTQTSVFMPSSEIAVVDNIPFLKGKLLEAYQQGGRRPLVVLAHSKGGVELFHTFVRNARDFPESVISKVFIVQAPLHGASYADIFMQTSDKLNGWNPLYWKARAKLRGVLSMLTSSAEETLAESESQVLEQDVNSLSERIFYVRSRQSLNKISSAFWLTAYALMPYGENDGVVLTESEVVEHFAGLRNFGTDLGVLNETDHMDLLIASEKSPESRRVKSHAFTKWIENIVVVPLRAPAAAH